MSSSRNSNRSQSRNSQRDTKTSGEDRSKSRGKTSGGKNEEKKEDRGKSRGKTSGGKNDDKENEKNKKEEGEEDKKEQKRATNPQQIARRVLLCRNGDADFPPTNWAYNSRTMRTWQKVVEDIGIKVLNTRHQLYGKGGLGIRALCSPDGGTRIQSIEELNEFVQGEDNDLLVICGPEKFKDIEGGYEQLKPPLKEKKERDGGSGKGKEEDGRDRSARRGQEEEKEETYMEKNKKKYGNAADRSDEQKLANRTHAQGKGGDIRKIMVKKNGEARFQPKPYIWRLKVTPTLDHLKTELKKIAPPDHGNVEIIYDMNGKEITKEDDIKEGETYVAAGNQEFSLGEDEGLTDSEDDEDLGRRARSRQRKRNESKEAKAKEEKEKEERERAESAKKKGKGGKGPGRPANRKEKKDEKDENGGKKTEDKAEEQDEKGKKWKKVGTELKEEDYEEINKRDEEMIKRHRERQKQKEKRRDSQSIYKRTDQTNPDAYLIYAFRNGAGTEAKCIRFNKKQLEKGLPYAMEVIARGFQINPRKLCAMDGAEIKSVGDLISKGAYVIVPLGESFRESWYYLPEHAIDTSGGADDDDDSGKKSDDENAKHNPKPESDQ